MDWLLAWLAKAILNTLDDLLSLIDLGITLTIKSDTVVLLQEISLWLSGIFFGIGVLISLTMLAEQSASGERANILAFAKASILGTACIAFHFILLDVYIRICELSSILVETITTNSNNPKLSTIVLGSDVGFFGIGILIFMLIIFIMIFFNSLTRLGELISYMFIYCLALLGVARGNNQLIGSIGFKIAGIFFVQFLQRGFFAAGLTSMYNAMTANTFDVSKPVETIGMATWFIVAWIVPKKIDAVLSSAVGGSGFGGVAMQGISTFAMFSKGIK